MFPSKLCKQTKTLKLWARKPKQWPKGHHKGLDTTFTLHTVIWPIIDIKVSIVPALELQGKWPLQSCLLTFHLKRLTKVITHKLMTSFHNSIAVFSFLYKSGANPIKPSVIMTTLDLKKGFAITQHYLWLKIKLHCERGINVFTRIIFHLMVCKRVSPWAN